MLPSSIAGEIALYATKGDSIGYAEMTSPIIDLPPHSNAVLYIAIEKVMSCAVPLLAKLKRPALLLPWRKLQAVVKAQRIVLGPGEEYDGIWHSDGYNENIVAVVLFYYRKSSSILGGDMEFAAKDNVALWTGDGGGEDIDEGGAENFVERLPRARVPIQEGTLVCFSNYQMVHRVLKMRAEVSEEIKR